MAYSAVRGPEPLLGTADMSLYLLPAPALFPQHTCPDLATHRSGVQAYKVTMEHSASSTVLSSVGKWLDQRIGRLMGPPTSGPPSNTSNASDAGPPLPQGGSQMAPGGMQLLPGGPHSVGPPGTASPKVHNGA